MRIIFFTFLLLFVFGTSSAKSDSSLCKMQPFVSEWYRVPYRFGGQSKEGIDCSSFVKLLYKNIFDIELPRTCRQQIKNIVKITKNQLEAGSIIFFKMSKNKWHVGVYLENGLFVHSSSSSGVYISNIDSKYWRKYIYIFGKVIK